MRRMTFDTIASAVGLLLAVLLLVAGGLLFWAYSFVNNQVEQQLTEQQITSPRPTAPRSRHCRPTTPRR